MHHNQSQINGGSSLAEAVTNKLSKPVSKEHHNKEEESSNPSNVSATHDAASSGLGAQLSLEADARFRALVEERDSLREEVAQVRRALEEMQADHEGELGNIREQLAETRGEKEQAEAQYKGLLGKVSTIRSQLGERLKADAVGPPIAYSRYCSQMNRRTFRKLGVELKTLKNSAGVFANRMTLVLLSWPRWQTMASSDLRNCQVFETEVHYHSRTGPKKEKICYAEKHMLKKNSRRPSRQCKIGRFSQWRSALSGRVSPSGSPTWKSK